MDPKELEKKYADLQKTVDNLHEILSAKYSSENQQKEAEELIEKVVAKIHPPKRKMAWASDAAADKDAEKIYLGQFLKAITPGAGQLVDSSVRAHIKATMVEGSDSLGGYVVPEEYSNEIIKLEQQDAIIRRLARIFPMGTDTRNLPKQLTNVSVSWTGEGTAHTETNTTLGRIVQTAKKVSALVKMTDELLTDNNAALDRFVMELVSEAMGREIDRVAFAGTTGGGDPFDGVLYASGVNSVSMAGASLVGDDLINLIMAPNAKYRQGGTLVMSTAALKLIMKLKDQNDNYIWTAPTSGNPGSIWGYPYEISDEIPVNLGTGTDETAILFGNWKKHYFVSDRGGYEVASSISAADPVNNQSAFLEDETWFRFKRRLDLSVANAAGFAKMQVK